MNQDSKLIAEAYQKLHERMGADNVWSNPKELRVSLNGHIELWISQNDIELSAGEIIQSNLPDAEKVAKLKEVAMNIAWKRIQRASQEGIKITADDLSVNAIDVDKIDWTRIIQGRR